MKTNLTATKNKKEASWVRNSLAICLALVFIAVGCQNKKNKSNPPPPPPPPPANYYGGNYGGALCPTCNMNVAWTIFAGSDSQSSSGAVSLSLDFYGDPNLGYYFYDPRIPMMYSGPVIVRGQMTINRVDSLICSVPVGQYQIISLSAGSWMGGVVTSGYSGYGPTSLTMQAQNLQYGNIVVLRLAKAVIYNQNGTSSWYPNKLGGTLMFDSNNGMPCYSYSGPTYTDIF
jgi:hypothetical protein